MTGQHRCRLPNKGYTAPPRLEDAMPRRSNKGCIVVPCVSTGDGYPNWTAPELHCPAIWLAYTLRQSTAGAGAQSATAFRGHRARLSHKIGSAATSSPMNELRCNIHVNPLLHTSCSVQLRTPADVHTALVPFHACLTVAATGDFQLTQESSKILHPLHETCTS